MCRGERGCCACKTRLAGRLFTGAGRVWFDHGRISARQFVNANGRKPGRHRGDGRAGGNRHRACGAGHRVADYPGNQEYRPPLGADVFLGAANHLQSAGGLCAHAARPADGTSAVRDCHRGILGDVDGHDDASGSCR